MVERGIVKDGDTADPPQKERSGNVPDFNFESLVELLKQRPAEDLRLLYE